MKKWMVYFINSTGHRDGNEYIVAETRSEALEIYCRFFNVSSKVNQCIAIPVFGASLK
jgi:hypothetical protein